MELSELTTLSACFFSRGELNRVRSGAIGDITVLDDFWPYFNNNICIK